VSVVTVQLFASYAELVGSASIDLPLNAGDRVSDLLDNLRAHPSAALLPAVPRVAVNRALADENTRVRPGDEIALIPPFAGG
jgi:molybdopterin converting factor small subunit